MFVYRRATTPLQVAMCCLKCTRFATCWTHFATFNHDSRLWEIAALLWWPFWHILTHFAHFWHILTHFDTMGNCDTFWHILPLWEIAALLWWLRLPATWVSFLWSYYYYYYYYIAIVIRYSFIVSFINISIIIIIIKHGWSKHGSSRIIKLRHVLRVFTLEPCLLQPCFHVAGFVPTPSGSRQVTNLVPCNSGGTTSQHV